MENIHIEKSPLLFFMGILYHICLPLSILCGIVSISPNFENIFVYFNLWGILTVYLLLTSLVILFPLLAPLVTLLRRQASKVRLIVHTLTLFYLQ